MKKKLDAFNIPLNGINLIEASAGTGKTTAIVIMYLRLLLGIEDKKKIKPLLIKEILIVTFTNSAKDEIHKRIKKNIEKLHLCCINNNTSNLILKPFLKKIKNLKEAVYILDRAKRDINNVAIYTIHGFCKDILQLNFFNINEEIIENETSLHLQATEDFWRTHFYGLPKDIIKIILQDYKNPKSLLSELQPIFNFNKVYFKKKINKNQNFITCHAENIEIINIFKKKWLYYNLSIIDIIKKLKINKKIYNISNITRWQKSITKWAQSKTENYQRPITLKYFSQETIKKNIKNNQILCHTFFKDIEEIIQKKNFFKRYYFI